MSEHGVWQKASGAAAPAFMVQQLVVKFRSSGAHGLTQCAQSTLARGASFARATTDASVSLDALVQQFDIRSARALMPTRAGLSTQAARSQLGQRLAQAAAPSKRPTAQAVAEQVANIYLLAGFPQVLNPDSIVDIPEHVAMGDLDLDGDVEVVATSQAGRVYIFQHDGSNLTNWPQSIREFATDLRVASHFSGKRIAFDLGPLWTSEFVVPGNGWQNYSTVSVNRYIGPGNHVMRIRFPDGDVNLNYWSITEEPDPN